MARSTKPIVAVTSAKESVDAAVEEALEMLGGPLSAIRPGMTVLLKPNMFQLDRPYFFSNPAILIALARRLKDCGARVIVAERLRNIYRLLEGSEIHDYAEVKSLDDMPLQIVSIESATSLRVPFAIPAPIMECDYFIGVPQLRTHASLLITNAMKNLIGLLPGYTTRMVHMAGVDESVVDLNVLRPQNLVVCDLTTVIEGNYPIHGTPRHVGLVVASTSAAAADVVSAKLSGFEPDDIAYLQHSFDRGLGPRHLEEVELRGLPLSEASFQMEKAPERITVPREGIFVNADTACAPCRRFIAGALRALEPAFETWQGEMTICAGRVEKPSSPRGVVVLVGNAQYENRDAGIFIEGCPPRAIQLAAFRYAMGLPVSAHERTQFRVPQ